MHERQIKTPFRTICEFSHEFGVGAPVFPEPFVGAFADLACGVGDSGYGDGGGGGEEGEEVVVEVGEEEDFAVGEGGEEGGLVDAVEGAGFEFTYSVCAYVSVRKFCFAWRRKKEQGQGRREEGGEGRGEEGRREGMRGREKEGEGKAE